MNPPSGKTAALALGVAVLALAGALVGTGAVSTGIGDGLFADDEPDISMVPHDGPGGQYVVEAENGQLQVDFTDPALTRNAQLEFHEVFDLVNEDDETVIVWVSHENGDVLRLYDHATGETIAGKENAISLAPGERVVVSVDVDSRDVSAAELVTAVTFAAELEVPFFDVDIADFDESVLAGQTIDIEAGIENVGNVADEREVRLLVDGVVVAVTDVSLDPDSSETVTFEYETDVDDIGNRTIAVETDDSSDERGVTVEAAVEPFFEVAIDGVAEEVNVGERLTVEATVENVGQGTDTQSVELVVDGEVVDEREVELEGGESESIQLGWTPEEGDEGTNVPVAVRSEDDEVAAEIDVRSSFIARASASSYAVSVGTEVELRAERSISPPDVTPSYEWTLGGEVLAEGERVSAVLSEPGEREVTLTMTGGGQTDTDTIAIDVEDETAPTIALDADDTVTLGDSIAFDASGSDDDVGIESFEWDFGDGTTAQGELPSHTYDRPGRYAVTLTVVDTSGNEATITEEILVESPQGTLSTDEIDFGEVGTGSTSGAAVVVNNTGTTALEMSNIQITGSAAFDLVGDAADGELAVEPGDSRAIEIEFSPTANGDETATLEFDSNNPGSLGSVSLTGSGIVGDLEPIESTIEFGGVPAGENERRTVTIENVGEGVVEITGAELFGSDAASFEIVDGGRAATLGPGETYDVTVSFDPTEASDRIANLRVVSEGSSVTVALRGTGEAPRIRHSPEEVRYRTIGVGDRTNTAVEIRNTGSEPLEIDDVDVIGDDAAHFRVDQSTVPDTVAPGESEPFDLWFEPEADGDQEATISIESNDPAEPTASVPVTGNAVGAEIGIDRKTIDFGETVLGETVYMDVTVRNKQGSPADLTIDTTEIVGSDPDAFFIESGGAPATLEPGESRTIEIGFQPLEERPMEAQLRILSDAGNRPLINVWLSNTRTYIIVQEVGNPTVNVEGRNLVSGGSHNVDVWTPTVEEGNVGFRALRFTTARSGSFEMNINHGERPYERTFEAIGESTIQYVELDHFETNADETFTGTGIQYEVSKTSVPADAGPEDVTLYRWNDENEAWTDLGDRAEFVEETDTDYVYEIETPGFSQFAATVPSQEGETGEPSGPGDGPSDEPSDGQSGGRADTDDGTDETDGFDEDGSSIQTDVDFGGDADAPAFRATEVSREEVIELDRATADQLPRALIRPREDRGRSLESDRTVSIGGQPTTLSAERTRILTAGEPVELSGERSTLGSGEAITDRDRMIGAVNIEVPSDRRDRPATIRLRIDRERFGESDPESAAIGHRTDEGWELLSTDVVDSTDEAVVLAAETPGFSVFGVFADPQVQYQWMLPDGDTVEGAVLNHTFAEPGLYEVELTVTDAFGRANTASYDILANDVPDATVEVVDHEGEEVTLAADVENEIGETEVTWTFPDGTEATGEEVTHTLGEGTHEIGLHVIDEFGAESQTEQTVAVGRLTQAVADALGMDLELLVQLGILSGLGLAFTVGYRRIPWGVFSEISRRGPEITALESPVVDVAARRFEIGALEVEDTGHGLDTITISVIDEDGHTVIRKRLDVSRATYAAAPETLAIPPGIDINADGSYTVRVKAVNTNGGRTERDAVMTAVSDLDADAR